MKNASWIKQAPASVKKKVPNSLANVMSYDGKFHVAITEECVTQERTDIWTYITRIHPNHKSAYFIKGLKCENSRCGSIEYRATLHSPIFLTTDSAYITDWFNESGHGKVTREGKTCKEECSWFWPVRSCETKCDRFSYETNEINTLGVMYCKSGYFVTFMKCHGTDCAFKNLHCKKLSTNAGIAVTRESYWTKYIESSRTYSDSVVFCTTDYYLTGLQCQGENCRSIRLHCTQIEVCASFCLDIFLYLF